MGFLFFHFQKPKMSLGVGGGTRTSDGGKRTSSNGGKGVGGGGWGEGREGNFQRPGGGGGGGVAWDVIGLTSERG